MCTIAYSILIKFVELFTSDCLPKHRIIFHIGTRHKHKHALYICIGEGNLISGLLMQFALAAQTSISIFSRFLILFFTSFCLGLFASLIIFKQIKRREKKKTCHRLLTASMVATAVEDVFQFWLSKKRKKKSHLPNTKVILRCIYSSSGNRKKREKGRPRGREYWK